MSRLYKCLLMQEICLIEHTLYSSYWPKYKLLRLKSVHGIFIWLPPWYFHWLIEKGIVGLVGLALQVTGKLWMQVPRNFLSTTCMLACKPVHLGIWHTLQFDRIIASHLSFRLLLKHECKSHETFYEDLSTCAFAHMGILMLIHINLILCHGFRRGILHSETRSSTNFTTFNL